MRHTESIPNPFLTRIPPREPVHIDGHEQPEGSYVAIGRGDHGWKAWLRHDGGPDRPIHRGAVIEVFSADETRVMQRVVVEDGPDA